MNKTSRNFFTGDYQKTKVPSEEFRKNFDNIDWTDKRTQEALKEAAEDIREKIDQAILDKINPA